MIKRFAAILLILVANITLLVHAVIPHHHHNEEVCIVSSHCDAESEEHHNQSNGHHHNEEGSKDLQCCDLNQISAVFISQVKHDYYESSIVNNKFGYTFAIGSEIDLSGPLFVNLPNTRQLSFLPVCSPYTGENNSLRAPPTA